MIRTTVYGKEGCFACKIALKWLMANGYQPAYVDLADDPDSREMFAARGIRALPVVTFDDGETIIRQIAGFQPDVYKAVRQTGA